MPAKKGQKKVAGRKKGTPNKSTAEVKAALILAYASIGGDTKFAEWAAANLTEFYKLWGKLLPLQLASTDGLPLTVQILTQIVPNATDSEDAVPALPKTG